MAIQYQQETFNLVEGQFTSAQSYADTAWVMIQDFMNDLINAAQFTLDFSDIDTDITPLPVTGEFSWAETPFSSTLMDSVITRLAALIVDGATGLGASVEAAIWSRARDRLQVTNERTYNEALTFWSARGHSLPPGALAGRLAEALAEQTRAEEAITHEIAIEQARLAQSNQQHSIDASNAMVGILIEKHNSYWTRDFEAAKYLVEGPIRVFEARVRALTAQVELSLKEAEVNLAMALETNRIQIETLKAGASVAAQLAASSLSAVNASASVGYDGGYRYSYQTSESLRESTSYEYVYQYYP